MTWIHKCGSLWFGRCENVANLLFDSLFSTLSNHKTVTKYETFSLNLAKYIQYKQSKKYLYKSNEMIRWCIIIMFLMERVYPKIWMVWNENEHQIKFANIKKGNDNNYNKKNKTNEIRGKMYVFSLLY